MFSQFEVLITILLYLSLFAWIGWRRGRRRELIVLVTAVVSWLVLQERGDVFVRVANLGGKFAAFIRAGGLGEDTDAAFAALGDAPTIVASDFQQGFLFIVWVVILIFTYYVTNQLVKSEHSPSDGWAVLIGMLNGFFYASVFLPRLLGFFVPAEDLGALSAAAAETSVMTMIGNTLALIGDAISTFWNLVQPIAPLVILFLVTLLVVIAASSLRRGLKTKS